MPNRVSPTLFNTSYVSYWPRGWVTDRSSSRGIPTQALGLQVHTACAIARAATSGSYARATGRAQRRRYGAKCSDAVSIKRKNAEVRLGLLEALRRFTVRLLGSPSV